MSECPSIAVLKERGFDFSTTFGMEFEFYCIDEDREGVANLLSRTGIDVRSEHYNHTDSTDHWKIVSDASLEDGEEGEYSCEDCECEQHCNNDCAYHCTPSYNCSECSVNNWDGPEEDTPECNECAELNDFPSYDCVHCNQEQYCDEDCSYHCTRRNSGRSGMELVSPILRGRSGIQQVYKLLEALNESLDCEIDSDCGLHVHLDGEALTYPAVRRLTALYLLYEPTIDSILPASRRNNCHCKSLTNNRWEYDPTTSRLDRLAHKFDQISSAAVLSELQRIWNDRYVKFNIESMSDHGTVEFRQHGGTLSFEKTLEWTILCMRMRSRARTSGQVLPSTHEYGPGLEEMMDDLCFSEGSRSFWTERRNQFARDMEVQRERDMAAGLAQQQREARRAEEDLIRANNRRVSEQEGRRWYGDFSDVLPEIYYTDYPAFLPSMVMSMIDWDARRVYQNVA